MTLVSPGYYATTMTFYPGTSFEYLYVNGTNPLKEVLNPAWACTNGNAQYTNRILHLGNNDTTICMNWATCNSCQLPTVPANTAVGNIILGEEESDCYNATEVITVAGNGTTFKVLEFGSATMIAGQKISILPGAQVMPGGYFHGYITTTGQYCNTPAAPQVSSTGNDGTALIASGALSLRIYPNPASDNVTFELKGSENCDQTRYEIFGMRGEIIRNGNFSGNGSYPVALQGIPSGVYYVRVVCGDQVVTKMLVKNQ